MAEYCVGSWLRVTGEGVKGFSAQVVGIQRLPHASWGRLRLVVDGVPGQVMFQSVPENWIIGDGHTRCARLPEQVGGIHTEHGVQLVDLGYPSIIGRLKIDPIDN